MNLYVTCDENQDIENKYRIYDENGIIELYKKLDNPIILDEFYAILKVKVKDLDNKYHIILVAGEWHSENIFWELDKVKNYDRQILEKVYTDINDLDESYKGYRLVTMNIIENLTTKDYHHCFVRITRKKK